LEIFRTGFSQKISGQGPPVPAEARGAGRGGGGAPFGWIRHTAGSDKCADEAFGWAMVAGMGWAIPEGREGLFFVFVFQGRLHGVGIWMQESSQKARCGIF